MRIVRKFSRKRQAVLDKIRSTTTHPSAVWVYEELRKDIPDISLGTVYRNLSVFKDDGLLVSVGVVNGQERFDADISEHTHFVCLNCNDVIDVNVPPSPELNTSVGAENHLDVYYNQLTFYGKCRKCRKNTAAALK